MGTDSVFSHLYGKSTPHRYSTQFSAIGRNKVTLKFEYRGCLY